MVAEIREANVGAFQAPGRERFNCLAAIFLAEDYDERFLCCYRLGEVGVGGFEKCCERVVGVEVQRSFGLAFELDALGIRDVKPGVV